MKEALLSIEDFSLSFCMYDKGVRQSMHSVITDLNLSVRKGEMLAVIGSSGSGKSLLAHSVLGILPANAVTKGVIRYKGSELTKERMRKLRGKEIALVPQSVDYLDPLMKVGKQIEGVYGSEKKRKSIFKRYALEEKTAGQYPFQLSGGMARRVLISTAVMGDARLIVADEPTPGLNRELAKEALRNFRDLADQGCGVVVITHDIDLALWAADRVAVFYVGTILEIADAQDFSGAGEKLRHPYSKALWQALPQNGFRPIPGFQSFARKERVGCPFAPGCPIRDEECYSRRPLPMRTLRGGEVCCIHAT